MMTESEKKWHENWKRRMDEISNAFVQELKKRAPYLKTTKVAASSDRFSLRLTLNGMEHMISVLHWDDSGYEQGDDNYKGLKIGEEQFRCDRGTLAAEYYDKRRNLPGPIDCMANHIVKLMLFLQLRRVCRENEERLPKEFSLGTKGISVAQDCINYHKKDLECEVGKFENLTLECAAKNVELNLAGHSTILPLDESGKMLEKDVISALNDLDGKVKREQNEIADNVALLARHLTRLGYNIKAVGRGYQVTDVEEGTQKNKRSHAPKPLNLRWSPEDNYSIWLPKVERTKKEKHIIKYVGSLNVKVLKALEAEVGKKKLDKKLPSREMEAEIELA